MIWVESTEPKKEKEKKTEFSKVTLDCVGRRKCKNEIRSTLCVSYSQSDSSEALTKLHIMSIIPVVE
jgi:hypothetical protein